MIVNKKRVIFRTIFTVFFVLSFTGCGGGGDGNDFVPSVQPLTYVGNTNPADITLTNAPTLLVNVLYGGDTATGVPTGASVSTSGDAATVVNRLAALLSYSKDNFIGNSTGGYYIPQGVDIDETIGCDTGYFTFNGTVDDASGAGTLAITYVDCVLDSTTYNGSGIMTFYYIDIYTGNTSASIDFVLLTMSGPDFTGSMSGIIFIDDYFSGNQFTETLNLNIVAQDDVLSKMYKFDGYTMTLTINDIYAYDSSAAIGYSGVIYDSIHGSISIENNSPLTFSSYLNTEPDAGGPIIMVGNSSRMQLTVESIKHVLLELDLVDNDGVYEIVRYVLWQELDDHTDMDLADIDGDGMHNSWETLYGLDPNTDDAGDDADIDGYNNLEEYQGGTDPENPLSVPAVP